MTTLAAAPRPATKSNSAFAELTATNAKELLRDGKTMFFIVFFPLFFLGLFGFLGFMIDSQNDAPVVEVTASAESEAVVAELEAAGIEASVADGATPRPSPSGARSSTPSRRPASRSPTSRPATKTAAPCSIR
jgi:ABC-2 type transport system permease protein